MHVMNESPADRGSRKWGLVATAFLLIAGFLLLTEHRAHLFGWFPLIFLLACPLLHVFMHGSHGGDRGRHARNEEDEHIHGTGRGARNE